MMKKISTKHLPEDLVVEILSRIPAVSLARLRSTSKGWNALVKDGRFDKKHSANAPRQSLVIMLIDFRVYLASIDLRGVHDNVASSAKVGQFSLNDPIYNSSEEVDIRNVFHSEGLLLCTTEDNRLVVCNPVSGETRWIQPKDSYKESDYYAFGYDNKSSCHKILRMYPSGNGIRTEYEVYDFTSNLWRVHVGVTNDWYMPRNENWGRGISVKGNTYWLADRSLCVILLSFDFSTDRFQSLSLPPDSPIVFYDVFLTVTREEQQLCMLFTVGSQRMFVTNLWIATRIESNGAMSWTKFLTLWGSHPDYRSQFSNALVDHENKVVLSFDKSGVSRNIIQIVGKNKYIEVDHHGAKPTQRSLTTQRPPTTLLLSYVPSFVQIQQDI